MVASGQWHDAGEGKEEEEEMRGMVQATGRSVRMETEMELMGTDKEHSQLRRTETEQHQRQEQPPRRPPGVALPRDGEAAAPHEGARGDPHPAPRGAQNLVHR